MTIEQLVSVLNNVEVKGDVNKEIEFITHDSRRVRKNTLFVCICGTRVDGNKFIPQAIEAGACAIMTEKDVEQAMMRYVRFPNELSTYDRPWGDVLIKSYSVKCPGLVLIPVPIAVGNRAVCVQLYFRDGVLEHSSISSF